MLFPLKVSKDFMKRKPKAKREMPIIHISRCGTIREGKNNDKLSQRGRHPPPTMHSVNRRLAVVV